MDLRALMGACGPSDAGRMCERPVCWRVGVLACGTVAQTVGYQGVCTEVGQGRADVRIRGEKQDAVVAVVEVSGRVLMIERAPNIGGGGYWTPPGGRVEPGESQAQAVVREVMEEVGITVRPVQRVWQCPTSTGAFRLHWWLAEYVTGEIVIAPDEVRQARWMTVQQFLSLDKTFSAARDFFCRIYPAYRSTRPV